MNEATGIKALKWLSQENYATRHAEVKSQRLPAIAKMSEWIMNSAQFQTWLADEQQVLLCLGAPGTGKTGITSMVIDKLFEEHGRDSSIGIAFLYPRTGRKNRDPQQLLRSVLLQLGQRMPSVPSVLVDLYRRSSTNASPPTVQTLLGVMSGLVANWSRVYLVIDALEQLFSTDVRSLLSGLLGLQETLPISIFAASDSRSDIIEQFRQCPTIDIGVDTKQDVQTYIAYRISNFPSSLRDFSDLIEKDVMRESEGSFLLANLLLDRLATSSNYKRARKISTQFSVSLNDLYEKKMKNIEQKPDEEQGLAIMAFAWLLRAQRPLKRMELQTALSIKVGSSEMKDGDFPDDIEIQTICEGLVVFTDKSDTWSLIHSSAAQYLQKALDTWYPESKTIVVEGCLTYLALHTFGESYCTSDQEFELRLQQNPLYEYAAKYWPNHFRDCQDLPEGILRSFLLNQTKVASASQAMSLLETEFRQPGYSQDFDHKQTGLHLASHLGLERIVEFLLKQGQDQALRDSQGRTPLWRATEANRNMIMIIHSRTDRTTFTLMLDRKESPLAYSLLRVAGQGVRDVRSRNAFHIGVVRQDSDLIQHAVTCGVDIDERDINGYSALQLAMQIQWTSGIDLLLQNLAKTEGITASSWLKCHGRPLSDTVELWKDSPGCTKFISSTTQESSRNGLPTRNKRRLRVFSGIAAWPMDVSINPKSSQNGAISWLRRELANTSLNDDYLQHYSVVAPMPVQGDLGNDRTFSYRFKDIRIGWTTASFPDSSGGDHLVAVDYLSTIQIGSVPESEAALFKMLIHTLMEGWTDLCNRIDGHLIDCRPDVLAANGSDPKLIRRLLEDANTWFKLRDILQRQIKTLRGFWDGNLQDFGSIAVTTEAFARDVSLQIDRFDSISASLVQIDFNLTSIREVQMSTSLNRSMKRLSWITFVFLPLVFVSGLFGMNVDILESNPSWKWCLVFMAGTLSLTMMVWIVFKRFPDLEDKLEDSFGWLARPSVRKQPLNDPEKGLVSGNEKKFV
ncbi:hypothetical protein C7974DRAFT_390939 [Boeremia exigua]|uniref:uncharacterized protein n=1 Tax=Boeremia exigua TaxID=749465 RepID=UPI001E8DA796|nr:uncharacterized protein C7974DRAFT_390939 [Boeremia exigua]KAH6638134.1 hypothetical protein C7974DRAFT_390939 [Boeremia exigua]